MVETPTKPPIFPLKIATDTISYPFPGVPPSPSLWQRLAIATAFLGLGAGVLSIGFSSLLYRLTHTTLEGGLVTGRLVRLQAPLEGEIKDFFASPGVQIPSGQVLARVVPSPQHQQTLVQLQGEVSEKSAQLAAAHELLNLLTAQLQGLEQEDQTLQTVNRTIAADEVSQQQAMMAAAIANATTAQTDYRRYQQLLNDGVVSQQQVDHRRAEWQSAQAMVERARAELNSAQTRLGATQQGVRLKTGTSTQQQRLGLMQAVQAQSTLIRTLTAQLTTSQQQLSQVQALYSDRQDVEVTAPFSGVIYSTEREAGEQISRPDVLLTLLDCNSLWVEVLMSAQEAQQIDAQKSVRVQLAGSLRTVEGEVKLIEAISRAELAKDQAQALTPAIPEDLVGQPLSRVLVTIPPLPEQAQAQQMCGVGQEARLTFATQSFAPQWLSRL